MEQGADGDRFRTGGWTTAFTMGASLTTLLTVDALLTDIGGGADLLRAVSFFGGLYFFVMVIRRIATGRRK